VVGRELGLAGRAAWFQQQMASHTPQARRCPPLPPPLVLVLPGFHLRHFWAPENNGNGVEPVPAVPYGTGQWG
jgi:hypothetical protein